MSHPTIRIQSTREIREREERWKIIRIAEMLALKVDKMLWDHDDDIWHTTFEAGGRIYGIKLDTVLVRNGPEDTPHKLRMEGVAFDRDIRLHHGWWLTRPAYSDFDLVGHPALRPLLAAVLERHNAVGRLIDSMIAELNRMDAA